MSNQPTRHDKVEFELYDMDTPNLDSIECYTVRGRYHTIHPWLLIEHSIEVFVKDTQTIQQLIEQLEGLQHLVNNVILLQDDQHGALPLQNRPVDIEQVAKNHVRFVVNKYKELATTLDDDEELIVGYSSHTNVNNTSITPKYSEEKYPYIGDYDVAFDEANTRLHLFHQFIGYNEALFCFGCSRLTCQELEELGIEDVE